MALVSWNGPEKGLTGGAGSSSPSNLSSVSSANSSPGSSGVGMDLIGVTSFALPGAADRSNDSSSLKGRAHAYNDNIAGSPTDGLAANPLVSIDMSPHYESAGDSGALHNEYHEPNFQWLSQKAAPVIAHRIYTYQPVALACAACHHKIVLPEHLSCTTEETSLSDSPQSEYQRPLVQIIKPIDWAHAVLERLGDGSVVSRLLKSYVNAPQDPVFKNVETCYLSEVKGASIKKAWNSNDYDIEESWDENVYAVGKKNIRVIYVLPCGDILDDCQQADAACPMGESCRRINGCFGDRVLKMTLQQAPDKPSGMGTDFPANPSLSSSRLVPKNCLKGQHTFTNEPNKKSRWGKCALAIALVAAAVIATAVTVTSLLHNSSSGSSGNLGSTAAPFPSGNCVYNVSEHEFQDWTRQLPLLSYLNQTAGVALPSLNTTSCDTMSTAIEKVVSYMDMSGLTQTCKNALQPLWNPLTSLGLTTSSLGSFWNLLSSAQTNSSCVPATTRASTVPTVTTTTTSSTQTTSQATAMSTSSTSSAFTTVSNLGTSALSSLTSAVTSVASTISTFATTTLAASSATSDSTSTFTTTAIPTTVAPSAGSTTTPVASPSSVSTTSTSSGLTTNIVASTSGVATTALATSSSTTSTITSITGTTTTTPSLVWTQTSAPIPVSPNGWTSIASSPTGQYLIAAQTQGLYHSSNYGSTWTLLTSAPSSASTPWKKVAISSSGQYIFAAQSAGYLYVSSNAGSTWTKISTLPGLGSEGIAASLTGQNLVAAGLTNGRLYVSSNYGTNWTNTNLPSFGWKSVAASSNGQNLVAAQGGNNIFTSSNSGVTWTTTNSPLDSWRSVDCSDSGQYLVAAGTSYIYTSSNFGANWTQVQTPFTSLHTVVSSASGQICVAMTSFRVYRSLDYGATWTQISTLSGWSSVACSSNCSKIAATAAVGSIYTIA